MIRRVKGKRTYTPNTTDHGRIERAIDICSDVIDFPPDCENSDDVVKVAIRVMKPLVELSSLVWPEKPAEEAQPVE